MSILTVVADFHAAEGKADELRAALEALMGPTRAEAGCLNYDLHQDQQDPGHFLFYENWETRAHWEAHNKTEHIQTHRAKNGALIASVNVSQMTRIEP